MPLYEFRCETCGEFEVWRSMAESSLPAACPACQTDARRIFSAPNVSLNRGRLPRADNHAPRLVQRRDREPSSPRYQAASSSRPWMIHH